jgi:hypothetical protein
MEKKQRKRRNKIMMMAPEQYMRNERVLCGKIKTKNLL